MIRKTLTAVALTGVMLGAAATPAHAAGLPTPQRICKPMTWPTPDPSADRSVPTPQRVCQVPAWIWISRWVRLHSR